MGEVYRAFDPSINREVAIKVLPPAFSEDPVRLRRFEQEAQAAGRLNHPNILAVHDVDTHDGAPYVVCELLEGNTLRKRLSGTPLPTRKAIEYALQIAHGLVAAHEQGIVHRDLKPENLFITKDGRVKILDFGLAKLTQPQFGAVESEAPTAPLNSFTASGVVVGTVGYMSPEQVRGEKIDHRSDIFSFGTVLYEMLSGRRAFHGESAVETLNGILKEEPPELTTLNRNIPPALERVVWHCLEKNPERRFQSAGDVAFALENVSATSSDATQTPTLSGSTLPRNRERMVWIAAVALLLIVIVAFAAIQVRKTTIEANTMRFPVVIPDGVVPYADVETHNMAVSPDGRYLAFVGFSGGQHSLWVRPLGALAAQLMPGTEGAYSIFWSPDSRHVAFFADGKLKRIEVSGKSLQTICSLPNTQDDASGTWGSAGTIVVSQDHDGRIYQVPAAGGTPSLLVDNKSQDARRWIHFLPDGRRFIFYKYSEGENNAGIYAGSLDSPEIRQVAAMPPARAQYVKGGYLLYPREGSLMAQTFDEKNLRLTSEAVVIVDHLPYFDKTGWAEFSASETGVLAYMTEFPKTRLVWLDRTGRETGLISASGNYSQIRLSPDEQRAVLRIDDQRMLTGDLWIQDLARDTRTRFVSGPTDDGSPVWSPDGRRVAYFSCCEDPSTLHIKETGDTSKGQLPIKDQSFIAPLDWSRDGRFIIYGNGGDLWVLPLSSDGKPYPMMQALYGDGGARFSPDGRWVAFVSNETSRSEVYVTRFDRPGEKWRISTDGGSKPCWRHDGRELFYLAANNRLMSVAIKPGDTFEASVPTALFKADPLSTEYDVTADGQRFLFIASAPGTQLLPFAVILDWTADLKH